MVKVKVVLELVDYEIEYDGHWDANVFNQTLKSLIEESGVDFTVTKIESEEVK